MRKRVRSVALLGLVMLLTSGCFLRLLLGAEVVESISAEVDRVISSVFAQTDTAVCRESPFGGGVECTYVIGTETTSTARLVSELGLVGVFIDPLVLELPATVKNITGTFDDGGGHHGNLVIYPKLSFVPIDDTRTLTPEPGKQLVVVDLPVGVPVDGVTYNYRLDFDQVVPAGPGPTPIKALLTGKLTVNGKTFYPPMLPCVDSFATVPAVTLPRSATALPLTLPQGLTGCANEVYEYFHAESVQVGTCDLNNDHVVDTNDLNLIMAVRNTKAAPGDPRDINGDGVINANDTRVCTLRCTRPGCKA